jgi:hypothetical protein
LQVVTFGVMGTHSQLGSLGGRDRCDWQAHLSYCWVTRLFWLPGMRTHTGSPTGLSSLQVAGSQVVEVEVDTAVARGVTRAVASAVGWAQ